jgi:MscS family membrane protein
MHVTRSAFSKKNSGFIVLCLTIFLLLFQFVVQPALSAEQEPSPEKQKAVTPKVVGPEDEFDRGVPRSSFKGYNTAANDKDFARAAEYLDLRNLPKDVKNIEGEKLAEMFRDILNRSLWVDTEMLSDHPEGYGDDGLPSYRDLLGQIEADKKTYNLLLQKVPRGDGVFIWKISNKTVSVIPELHELLGYGPFGDALDAIFPDIEIFGTKLWQWVGLIIILVFAYIVSFIISTLIIPIIRRNLSSDKAERIMPFIKGPLRFLIWIMLAWSLEGLISPTVTLKMLMKGGTLIIIAVTWILIWLFDFYIVYMQQKFEKEDRLGATVLLKPARTVVRIVIVVIAFLAWLDNIGFQVTTLLAGLGVGGIAIALAAQAILADFIAAIILLMSQPVRVGDFCKFGNTLGTVEDIGLRENYALREKVWFHPKIKLPYETGKDTIRKITSGIEEMLKNHPEVHDEPIQVYFTEIGDYSHNIDVFSYVTTGDYGKYKKIAHELNTAIMEIVEKAGARLALPSRKMYVDEGKFAEVENDT